MIQPLVVSVCIANYNGMAVIDDCIRSVTMQSGEVSVEILIHDDASNDGSPAHIREQYPHVKLIESAQNVGFCIANNRMAAAAQGQYVLLLNNDAMLYPDALETLFSEALRIDRPAILSLPQYDARSGELIDRGCLLDPFYNPVPNIDPRRSEVAMVIGACLWIPKDLWIELGGFPDWFGSIAEDMYLCCRARLEGFSVIALNASGYRHRQGYSFGGNRVANNRLTTTFKRRALSERNKTFVMICTSPRAILSVILPLHLALLLLEGTLLSLVKRDITLLRMVYVPIFPSLWQMRNRLLPLREKLQKQRRIGSKEWMNVFQVLPHKIEMLLRHGLPEVR